MCPARLFIISGGELLSKEGTTQGDPTSMCAYARGILPLLQSLLDFVSVHELNTEEVAFADDFRVAGKWPKILLLSESIKTLPHSKRRSIP